MNRETSVVVILSAARRAACREGPSAFSGASQSQVRTTTRQDGRTADAG